MPLLSRTMDEQQQLHLEVQWLKLRCQPHDGKEVRGDDTRLGRMSKGSFPEVRGYSIPGKSSVA